GAASDARALAAPSLRPLPPPSNANAAPPATQPRPSPRSDSTTTYLSLVVEWGRPLIRPKRRRSMPAGAGGATTTATLPDSTVTATGPAATTLPGGLSATHDLPGSGGRKRQGDRIGRQPAAPELVETVESKVRDVCHRRSAGE